MFIVSVGCISCSLESKFWHLYKLCSLPFLTRWNIHYILRNSVPNHQLLGWNNYKCQPFFLNIAVGLHWMPTCSTSSYGNYPVIDTLYIVDTSERNILRPTIIQWTYILSHREAWTTLWNGFLCVLYTRAQKSSNIQHWLLNENMAVVLPLFDLILWWLLCDAYCVFLIDGHAIWMPSIHYVVHISWWCCALSLPICDWSSIY